MLVRQLTMVAVGVLLIVPVSAQEAPQTSWGAPDLQGIWDFRSITPLERPEDLAEQEFLSEEEAADLEQAAVDRIEELANREAERTEVGGNQLQGWQTGWRGGLQRFLDGSRHEYR